MGEASREARSTVTMNHWDTAVGLNSWTLGWMKEPKHKRIYKARFYLNEDQEQAQKAPEIEIKEHLLLRVGIDWKVGAGRLLGWQRYLDWGVGYIVECLCTSHLIVHLRCGLSLNAHFTSMYEWNWKQKNKARKEFRASESDRKNRSAGGTSPWGYEAKALELIETQGEI